MKRTIFYILAFLMVCSLISCAVKQQEGNGLDVTTGQATMSTETTGEPQDTTGETQKPVAPEETKPEQTVPELTNPKPTLPPIGTDPGGFGPIF